jgi:hypothetical protein
MRLVQRASCSVLIAFALTTSVFAQAGNPTAADDALAQKIARQLSSDDPKAVAWGGYLATEHRMRGSVPDLVKAIASRRLQQSRIEWSAARNAVFDALIQLGGHPPPNVLLPYYPEHREPVLILLSEPRPGRDEVLLKLLKEESGIPWYAIAGLLLEVKAAGLAAELLRGLRLTLDVMVVDGPPEYGPTSSFGHGGGIGDGVLYPAPGFPSIATYSLWHSAVRGATVLAEGPHPVYHTRKQSPPDWIPSGPSGLTIDAPDAKQRLEYLEELLEHWLPVEPVEKITLQWTTPERLRADVARHRERIGRKYGELIALAQKRKRLTAAEAKALVATIDVQVQDLRRNKSTRLPDASR